ncbi:16S rRNA (adenine(1518)-N(6)/adenine(1519)-N(6))-dimethyltransferase RsmA [Verrucomicrobiales bacterium]|nr:16S rRNA (adenine(1518)-N(6)/adenine(1519)-N(6))-dimethyltransferase RsmA [Verrucomicrobiales bacterium]MDF1788545.1 16S rRNA (adenine(1518)-N(6)/adenine(1519)-N(6))-dimethyltransferase RsmA [Verrucomicrobiales bacterium]
MSTNTLRPLLERLRVRPSKKLGQNFLIDDNISRWIVGQLKLEEGDSVLEVGPGTGAMSEILAESGVKTWLVEFDERLADYLVEHFADTPNVTVAHEDAVKHDARFLFAEQPVGLLGNLPYSCGGHIMIHYLMPPSPFSRAVFMLQKEVAERVVAKPRTKDYGAFSLRIQAYWRARMLKSVGPAAFYPRPQVDSSVIALERRKPSELPTFDHATFDRLVRQGFSQRRKQLKNVLSSSGLNWEAAVDTLGLNPAARAEELTLEQWIELARMADDHPLKDNPQKGDELFDVVDEADQVLRQETRQDVHANGWLHRAIHVFVFNKAGELFLQKRSHLKDAHPSVWDSSASGHLDAGEDYDTAVVREIEEELGISGQVPEYLATLPPSQATGWEHVKLYRAKAPKRLRYPASEIETGGYFSLEFIEKWIAQRPQDFASGFIKCFYAFIQ